MSYNKKEYELVIKPKKGFFSLNLENIKMALNAMVRIGARAPTSRQRREARQRRVLDCWRENCAKG